MFTVDGSPHAGALRKVLNVASAAARHFGLPVSWANRTNTLNACPCAIALNHGARITVAPPCNAKSYG